MDELQKTLLDLARLGMNGDTSSVRRYVKKILTRKPAKDGADADYREQLTKLLIQDSTTTRMARSVPRVNAGAGNDPAPITRVERVHLAGPPLLEASISEALEHIVAERKAHEQLRKAGVEPTRSVLLTGPPGVGKTLTARYLAERLGIPLMTLELSALMSSYLGRSGQNLRNALVHGAQEPCVLFLDEFDAVGKRRDDPGDVGELKRIVNVLLLELDDWSSNSLLVAATNHPELLDRAVWRRFDMVLQLKNPDAQIREALVSRFLEQAGVSVSAEDTMALVAATVETSPADIERLLLRSIRQVIVSPGQPAGQLLVEAALEDILQRERGAVSRAAYCHVAKQLGKSQREIGRNLGISHVAVGKILKQQPKEVR